MTKLETKLYFDIEYIYAYLLGDITKEQLENYKTLSEAAYEDPNIPDETP